MKKQSSKLKKIVIVLSLLSFSCINPFSPESFGPGDSNEFDFCLIVLEDFFIYQERLPSRPYSYETPAGLYASVNDPFTNYYNPDQAAILLELLTTQTTGIGIFFDSVYNGFVIDEVFQESPAEKAGLMQGDTILELDSVQTAGRTNQEFIDMVEGEPGEKRNILIKRDADTLDIDIILDNYLAPSVFTDSLDSTTSYIYLMMFSDSTVSDSGSYGEMKDALSDASASENIILDLRENGGGALSQCIDIVSLFVPESTEVVSIHERTPNDSYTRVIVVDSVWVTTKPGILSDQNLYILVNENTASASEILVSCMIEQRSSNTTVVGSQTYGKGCGQIYFSTPKEGIATVTSLLIDPVYSPSYNLTGLMPDIDVSENEDAKEVALNQIQESYLTKAGKASQVDHRYEQIKALRESIYDGRDAPGLWIRDRLKKQ